MATRGEILNRLSDEVTCVRHLLRRAVIVFERAARSGERVVGLHSARVAILHSPLRRMPRQLCDVLGMLFRIGRAGGPLEAFAHRILCGSTTATRLFVGVALLHLEGVLHPRKRLPESEPSRRAVREVARELQCRVLDMKPVFSLSAAHLLAGDEIHTRPEALKRCQRGAKLQCVEVRHTRGLKEACFQEVLRRILDTHSVLTLRARWSAVRAEGLRESRSPARLCTQPMERLGLRASREGKAVDGGTLHGSSHATEHSERRLRRRSFQIHLGPLIGGPCAP
mmetsp:Transcript_52400/g.135783  ORF Transcript_52400/g.135783 Transcript_52400/m.135783 type:complete len:282 (-) Transcript_52400:295-1140(-)